MAISKPKMVKPSNGVKKPAVKKMTPPKLMKKDDEVVVEPIVINEPEKSDFEEAKQELEQQQKQVEEVVQEEQPQEEVVEEEVVEEKPKAKKKSSKKKKEEVKVEESVETFEELPQMSLRDAVEAMEADVKVTTPEWEEAKQEIQDKLNATSIDADMNPATMRNLIGELDDLMTQLRFFRTDMESQVKACDEQIEYIRLSNSKGSNSEERKSNGYRALMNYKKNPDDVEFINLIQYQVFMHGQLSFVNEAIETIKDRKQLLITFSSMIKIEANI